MHTLPDNRVASKSEVMHFAISLLLWMFGETWGSAAGDGNWWLVSSTAELFSVCTLVSRNSSFWSPSVYIKFISLKRSDSSFTQELMKDGSARRHLLLFLHLLRLCFHFWGHPQQCQVNRSKPLLIVHYVLTRITNLLKLFIFSKFTPFNTLKIVGSY